MRIVNNEISDFALRQVKSAERDELATREQLASGRRINHARDDAAGLAVSEGMEARQNGIRQAWRNTQDAQQLIQVAEGAFDGITGMIQRIRTLAIQAANDTYSDPDRALSQLEVSRLISEINRQASATTYNSRQLLAGTTASNPSFVFQVGANRFETVQYRMGTLNSAALGINVLSVGTRSAAALALTSLDNALLSLGGRRADLGSLQNRFEKVLAFNDIARENTLAAQSQIRDTEFASTITDYTKQEVLRNTRLSALSQANLQPQSILALLQ